MTPRYWPALVVLLLASSAGAQSGAMFGETSRTASLAGAVTARRGETSAIGFNPGALADLEGPRLALHGHAGGLSLSFQRHGEPAQDMDRLIAGFGFALGTPLIGPWWLRLVRFGIAAHVPAQHALKLRAPSRPDVPAFVLYGDRAERTAVAAALAVKLFDRIGVGGGVTLTPRLLTPTLVSYVPGRGTPDQNVVVDLERELRIEASATFGVRAELHRLWSIGLAYRQQVSTGAEGPNDTKAGALLVDDQIDFYDFLEPDEIAFGVAAQCPRGVSLSFDLVRSRWSRFQTIHHRRPEPSLSDVHSPRLGLEYPLPHGVRLRAGYAFEPSPVPDQPGETNLLDADRHVLALGAGWDLRPRLRLRIDGHLRAHLLGTQEVQKDAKRLGDFDPELPGEQLGNLGYPGFRATGSFWQGGLTLTLFLSKEPP